MDIDDEHIDEHAAGAEAAPVVETPEAVQAPGETPRDEMHDSYDPATGGVTLAAQQLRRERGITAAGLQADAELE